MRRIDTALPHVFVIAPDVFRDARGFFTESYHQQKFAELGVRTTFVQDNHSRSCCGTLRGLHYQLPYAQAKLCRVVEGAVLDVVVDIRMGSPHFGRWISVVLSEENHREIFVPAGFAHGFCTLSDSAQFLYKCSDFYHPEAEHGIAWNDPVLKIEWGIAEPLLSSKDQTYPQLAQVPRELLPRYQPEP